MIIDPSAFSRLDHGSFKAFTAAARALNFTAAADKAAMTQSGISQHIAKLERQLGSQLFVRINKKVALTRAGEILLQFIDTHHEKLDHLFEVIHGESNRVRGKVRYGMPHSCLFTPHFSMLLEKRKTFGEVELDVRLSHNDLIFEMLLNQQIDFGFVTKKCPDPAVQYRLFCQEQYVLIGAKGVKGRMAGPEELLKEKFISYPGMNVLFDFWSRHNFKRKAPAFESLRIIGAIESLHGAITLVRQGVGLTVLPQHCSADLASKREITEIQGPNKSPLLNNIYIVTLKNVNQPRRVNTVIDAFFDMMKH